MLLWICGSLLLSDTIVAHTCQASSGRDMSAVNVNGEFRLLIISFMGVAFSSP